MQTVFTSHRQPILQSSEGQVMDMKRFILLILLTAVAGGTTGAEVRFDLEAGIMSGTATPLDAIEADLEGQIGCAAASVFLGEGATIQTPSLAATLAASHAGVTTLDTVTFDASGSLPGDGVITLYEWDLDGDGVFDVTSPSETLEHVYTDGGIVFVQVRVTNDLGESALSEMLRMDIVNRSPIAEFEVNLGDGSEDSLIQFLDRSNDVDGEIVHVAWNFGDGMYQAGGPLSDNVYSHVFAAPGTYIVTLYVIDNDGGIAHTQSAIEVF